MNELNEEVQVMNDDQVTAAVSEEPRVLDYDEQPYGNDDVLVRASKRRSFLASAYGLGSL